MGVGHAHALYVHEHSAVHRLAPQVKIVAAVGFVLAVAVTPREALWAFAIHAGALVGVAVVSRVRLRFVAVRLLAIAPFVAFAFIIPFVSSGERVEVLGLGVSREGLWSAWAILARASLGAATSILLAATTEVADILGGLSRLRVPSVLVSVAGFMVRYLELVAEQIRRMRTAMTARGYDPRWLWQARPLAASAGSLFVRSYERGERVHDAMVARGFTGTMPDLRRRDPTAMDWARGTVLPLVAGVVSLSAMVIT